MPPEWQSPDYISAMCVTISDLPQDELNDMLMNIGGMSPAELASSSHNDLLDLFFKMTGWMSLQAIPTSA